MKLMIDEDSYAEVTNHENGAAHLGCWFAIVMAAAKSKKRGALLRSNGSPHTPETLARLTRLPVEVLAEALSRFVVLGLLASSENLPLSPANPPLSAVAANLPLSADISRYPSLEERRGERGDKRTGERGDKRTGEETENLPLSAVISATAKGSSRLKELERQWMAASDPSERQSAREAYQRAHREAGALTA